MEAEWSHGRAAILAASLKESPAVFSREGEVVVRPAPDGNLVLISAGTSLHTMTTDEADYLRLFLYAARLWARRMPCVLCSQPFVIAYVQDNVVRPLFELAYMVATVGAV